MSASRWLDAAPLGVAIGPTALALAAALRFPFTASPGAAGAQLLGGAGGLARACAMALRGARRDARGFAADARWGAAVAAAIVITWTLASVVSEAMRPACGASKGVAPFVTLALPV
ncbi:MAG: hypothetical protein HY275_01480, partial [Gemmatimonadetes bacterium]|nr:hypothetical protein [Gemmatimonadota bacterium]